MVLGVSDIPVIPAFKQLFFKTLAYMVMFKRRHFYALNILSTAVLVLTWMSAEKILKGDSFRPSVVKTTYV